MKHSASGKPSTGARIVVSVLPLVWASSALAQQSAENDPPPIAEVEQSQPQKAKREPRMKFKRGPVCMCNQAMSEKELQQKLQPINR